MNNLGNLGLILMQRLVWREWSDHILYSAVTITVFVFYIPTLSVMFSIFLKKKNMGNTFLLCHIFKNTMIVHNMLKKALFLGMSPAPATARAGRTTPSQVPR